MNLKERQLNSIAIKNHKTVSDEQEEVLFVTRQLQLLCSSLEDAKAENIVSIDMRMRSVFADFMVIASGRSKRHVLALADQCLRQLRDEGIKQLRIEGLENADWVLLDTGDIIIHLFCPEIREFYNLEKIWLHRDDA